jgi:hypothetical protein
MKYSRTGAIFESGRRTVRTERVAGETRAGRRIPVWRTETDGVRRAAGKLRLELSATMSDTMETQSDSFVSRRSPRTHQGRIGPQSGASENLHALDR